MTKTNTARVHGICGGSNCFILIYVLHDIDLVEPDAQCYYKVRACTRNKWLFTLFYFSIHIVL